MAIVADLKDDETRMARFNSLSPERKAEIRAQQQAELTAATKERQRPLTSRFLDMGSSLFAPQKRAEDIKRMAAEDIAAREARFQRAKTAAEMSDEQLDAQQKMYGDTKVHKLKDQQFSKGGKVKAFRGDGIAKRGKTKGRFV